LSNSQSHYKIFVASVIEFEIPPVSKEISCNTISVLTHEQQTDSRTDDRKTQCFRRLLLAAEGGRKLSDVLLICGCIS